MKKMIFAATIISVFTVGTLFTVHSQTDTKQAPATKASSVVSIERLVVGTAVENREPVGVAETFPSSTEKVLCFLEARNIAEDTEITVVWIYNGQDVLKTNLALKAGSRWRTRADKNLYGKKGDWKVEIRDKAGNVLKDVKFKVE